MYTFQASGSTTFNFNSDFSGDLYVNSREGTAKIRFADMDSLMAYRLATQIVYRIEGGAVEDIALLARIAGLLGIELFGSEET